MLISTNSQKKYLSARCHCYIIIYTRVVCHSEVKKTFIWLYCFGIKAQKVMWMHSPRTVWSVFSELSFGSLFPHLSISTPFRCSRVSWLWILILHTILDPRVTHTCICAQEYYISHLLLEQRCVCVRVSKHRFLYGNPLPTSIKHKQSWWSCSRNHWAIKKSCELAGAASIF